jgi:hypothetical protein
VSQDATGLSLFEEVIPNLNIHKKVNKQTKVRSKKKTLVKE